MKRKMQLLIIGTILSFAGSIFADIVVYNRSNMPIAINWARSSNKDKTWTPSIAPGATYTIVNDNKLNQLWIAPLKQGIVSEKDKDPGSANYRDTSGWMGNGAFGSSFPTPTSVFFYGDHATDGSKLLAAASVADASGTVSGQLLLSVNSLSRYAGFVTGTMTAADEKAGAQPVIVQTVGSDGKVALIAAPTVVA